MGRRPELKSDEFSYANVVVYEIMTCEDFFTAEKVLHFFGALPPGSVNNNKNKNTDKSETTAA